jgi:hypothetical protein
MTNITRLSTARLSMKKTPKEIAFENRSPSNMNTIDIKIRLYRIVTTHKFSMPIMFAVFVKAASVKTDIRFILQLNLVSRVPDRNLNKTPISKKQTA